MRTALLRHPAGLLVVLIALHAQAAHSAETVKLRAPAVPLVAHDPYFSVWSAADRLTDASIRQCGYRFNSYIGFAVVLALYGNTGMALFALLVGVWVPISNAVAVADLAAASQSEGSGIKGILKSIFTNPLIIATLAGLFFNVTGLQMPALVTSVFKSLGSASLALALMAIGSGLRLEDFRKYGKLISLATVERLIAVPAVSFAVGLYFHLTPVEMGALLSFTALPTANSCYILAVRMEGNGPAVADLDGTSAIVFFRY